MIRLHFNALLLFAQSLPKHLHRFSQRIPGGRGLTEVTRQKFHFHAGFEGLCITTQSTQTQLSLYTDFLWRWLQLDVVNLEVVLSQLGPLSLVVFSQHSELNASHFIMLVSCDGNLPQHFKQTENAELNDKAT